jgi:hypothetical protein
MIKSLKQAFPSDDQNPIHGFPLIIYYPSVSYPEQELYP